MEYLDRALIRFQTCLGTRPCRRSHGAQLARSSSTTWRSCRRASYRTTWVIQYGTSTKHSASSHVRARFHAEQTWRAGSCHPSPGRRWSDTAQAPSTAAQTDGQAGGRPASGRTVSSDQVDQVKRALKRYDWDPKVVLLMLVEGYGVRQLGEVPEERGAELLADATSTKAKSRWASVLQERQRLKAADGRAA